jgi:hypothetical protein
VLADVEAAEYCEDLDIEYVGLAQSFGLLDPPAYGTEVFSYNTAGLEFSGSTRLQFPGGADSTIT